MLRVDLLDHLAELLNIDHFDDYCVNGLQVEGKPEISCVITGVSAHLTFLQRAIQAGADLIIVHHGLFWKNDRHPFRLIGPNRDRLKVLLEAEANLCAYHLPLDCHPDLGNNALICQILELTRLRTFDLGYLAAPQSPRRLTLLLDHIKQRIHQEPIVLRYGPDLVSNVAVVSGSPGNQALIDAKNAGADTFLCGGISESTPYLAEELAMNFINAGHYNTETFGVKALGEYIENTFGLQHQFIRVTNPI
ncbi:Nif3-like dinuclear metal center hexameric protein [bacterium]|nr:Nif3-like dinuclear metal center hexameric protein [bacterium]